MDSIWLLGFNAAAGCFGAATWGFFAVVRARNGRHLWAVVDLAMAAVSGVVAAGYISFILDPATPPVWLRWFVIPALVLPASAHLASWMQARRFIAAADPGDE